MKQRKGLTINTTAELALQLGLPEELLFKTAERMSGLYHSFSKKDAKGKERDFYEARGDLKLIQRRIDRRLLDRVKLPPSFRGGIKGHSTTTNAAVHTHKRVVVKLDIKSFFPTVTSRRVYNTFQKLGCKPDVARLLARFTTADGHLAQGFTTSPKVSALVLLNIDLGLKAFLAPLGLRHSLWIDDLAISGNQWHRRYLKTIYQIFEREGFTLHKEEIITAKERQLITGLVVNHQPNLIKERKKKLRHDLYLCAKLGLAQYARQIDGERDPDKTMERLAGRVGNALSANPVANKQFQEALNGIIATYKESQKNYGQQKRSR